MVDYVTEEEKPKKEKTQPKSVKVVIESLEDESTKVAIAEEKAVEDADLTLKTVAELKN